MKSLLKSLGRRLMEDFATDKESISSPDVPMPIDEIKRLEVVKDMGMMDSNNANVEMFQRLCAMAARMFKADVALISIVAADHVVHTSQIGYGLHQTSRRTSFCSHTVAGPSKYLIVPDLSKDKVFIDNPFLQPPNCYRFYAGVNIVIDGMNVGTLCVLDKKPMAKSSVEGNIVQNFVDLANIIQDMFINERDQFIAAECERAEFSLKILANLKYPLKVCNAVFQDLVDSVQPPGSSSESLRSQGRAALLRKVGTFSETIDLLSCMADTSLTLAQYHAKLQDMESSITKDLSLVLTFSTPRRCDLGEDLLPLLHTLREVTGLGEQDLQYSLDWPCSSRASATASSLQRLGLGLGADLAPLCTAPPAARIVSTHLELLCLTLYTAVVHLSQLWGRIQVECSVACNPQLTQLHGPYCCTPARPSEASDSPHHPRQVGRSVLLSVRCSGPKQVSKQHRSLHSHCPACSSSSSSFSSSSCVCRRSIRRSMSRSFDDSQVAVLNDDILRTVGGGCRFASMSPGDEEAEEWDVAGVGGLPYSQRLLHIWLPLYPLVPSGSSSSIITSPVLR